MEELDKEDSSNSMKVDVWGKASRFYYSIGTMKEKIYPEIVSTILSGLYVGREIIGYSF
jgi:hypothetical protein